MKKQVILVGITLMFVLIAWSGCVKDEPSSDPLLQQEYARFFGTWDTNINDSKIWEFASPNYLSMQSSDGTMHGGQFGLRKDDALVRIFNPQVSYFYEFSVNDQALTLSLYGDSLGHSEFIVLTRVATSSEEALFEITNKETSDNFATVSEEGYTGTVWVNATIRNPGAARSGTLQVQVYQGTGNYTDCGKDYSSVFSQTAYLQRNETTTLHFTFTGVETHNNTGCYGVYYGIH